MELEKNLPEPGNAPQPAAPAAARGAPPALDIPDDALILVPVRNLVLFPGMVLPVTIGRESSVESLWMTVFPISSADRARAAVSAAAGEGDQPQRAVPGDRERAGRLGVGAQLCVVGGQQGGGVGHPVTVSCPALGGRRSR